MIRFIPCRLAAMLCLPLLCVAGSAWAGTLQGSAAYREQLLFTTERIYPVLDGGSASLELLLVSARRGPSATTRGDGLGTLPASFDGDLPGANSSIPRHLDLYPEGRFQLRTTYVDKPAPNQFDDIGRWSREAGGGRIAISATCSPVRVARARFE